MTGRALALGKGLVRIDDDLTFTGPIDTFGSADAFMQSIQGLSQIKEDLVNTHWSLLYWEPMRQYFATAS